MRTFLISVAAALGGVGCNRNVVAFVQHRTFFRHSIVSLSAENDNDDFPTWFKALTKWDTRKGRSNNRKSPTWEEEMMSPLVASLSGMVNVERLVNAANETDEDMDLLLDDLKRSLLDTTESKANGRQVNGDRKDEEAPLSSTKNLFPFLDNALRFDEFAKSVKELTDLIPDDKGMNVTFDELVNLVPDSVLSSDELVEMDRASVELKNKQTSISNTDVVTPENILKLFSQRLDFIINGTNAFSPSAFQSLIVKAGKALEEGGKQPAEYTKQLVEYANDVISGGYTPLFTNYPSVQSIPLEEQKQKVIKAAEFASLSGAIYEDAIPRTHMVGHSIIAQGKTADIGWMVTDSVQYEQNFRSDSDKDRKPTLVRTFVLRGYDASDEEVDREKLLNMICTASPVQLYNDKNTVVRVHEGMLSMAEELFGELEQYIDLTSPSHKFAFTGHSIGGSLAILLMILLRNDRGASFVRQNVLRVFTFGSPPIFELESTSNLKQNTLDGSNSCSILDVFGLPTDIVYSYCQPWDPITRLFSRYDPLYPLIDDLGEDGYTPWVSGPTRTLRPILKTILESWEGWPQYRDNARVKLGQDYSSVGLHYLLLPEPIRFLTDKLVSVNTQVPEVDNVVQISTNELLPALNEVFTLDVFAISYVSVAIRSFVHHFYPAYRQPILDYAEKVASGDLEKE